MVRVEDELWEAAKEACDKLGTTRAEVMREALRKAVKDAKTHGQKGRLT
jgi:antitoxin component of RelBE/YafQ-DinJ toxin-antitoxin module